MSSLGEGALPRSRDVMYRYRYLLRCQHCGGLTVLLIDVSAGHTTAVQEPICNGRAGWSSPYCDLLAPRWERLRVDTEPL